MNQFVEMHSATVLLRMAERLLSRGVNYSGSLMDQLQIGGLTYDKNGSNCIGHALNASLIRKSRPKREHATKVTNTMSGVSKTVDSLISMLKEDPEFICPDSIMRNCGLRIRDLCEYLSRTTPEHMGFWDGLQEIKDNFPKYHRKADFSIDCFAGRIRFYAWVVDFSDITASAEIDWSKKIPSLDKPEYKGRTWDGNNFHVGLPINTIIEKTSKLPESEIGRIMEGRECLVLDHQG